MSTDDLTEGSKFGSYIIGECIGRGGMARIYRAEHEGLRRHVALKVLNRSFARDRQGRERFLREARIAAAVKHPNVVNIFDVGVQGSVPYLVMELLEGADLETMMRGEGALSEATLVDILVPIVAGLSAVHDAGFVHRDLKPGNIYVARGRNDEIEPKLLDFGISRAAESEPVSATDPAGLIIGTPRYMSPEAVRGEEITALSDQYSLGVVLYECSTGFNPFAADTLPETIRRVTTGSFAPPTQYNPMLSRRVVKVIQRAMSLDPKERFSDLKEMGRALLSMAGQRTQIAWSLSFFGDVTGGGQGEKVGTAGAASKRSTPARPTADSAPRSAAVAPPVARRPFFSRAAVPLALFGAVTLLTAAVMSWSSAKQPQVEAQALRPTSSTPQPLPAEIAKSSNKSLTAVEAPALTTPAPSKAGGRSPQVEDSPRSSNEERRGRAPVAPSEAARSRASRPARNQSSRVAPQPRPEPPRAQPVEEASTPDWLVPVDPSRRPRQRRPNTTIGTNGAPILE